MPRRRRLVLVLPGLLGPVSDVAAVARLQPALPALARLWSRADCLADTAGDAHASIFAAFGVTTTPPPIAAAARAGEADGDTVELGDHWWLRVDPVHLRVDQTQVRLYGGYALDLAGDESAALIARLNEFYAADGLVFAAPAPDRWYLARPHASDLDVAPLDRVVGRNVDVFMPDGADAPAWRGWLTEVQMLLHAAPLNEERTARGAFPVNSVWFWGGGRAPAVHAADAPVRVWSSEPVARGLARLAGTPMTDWPVTPPAADWPQGTTLAVRSDLQAALFHGDIDVWLQRLAELERDWFEPLCRALRGGRLDELSLLTGDGRRLRITRHGLRRFWRRRATWTDALAAVT